MSKSKAYIHLQKKTDNATLNAVRASLEGAFRATAYCVRWPDRSVRLQSNTQAEDDAMTFFLRIDQPCSPLDDWLSLVGAPAAAYLTAVNPQSRQESPAYNTMAMARLLDEVKQNAWSSLKGEALADDGLWPAEPSVLVAGLSREQAASLAQSFDQTAFLWVALGEKVQICWLHF